MTAPVADYVLEELTDTPRPCECSSEHPGQCDNTAVYAVRLSHLNDCGLIETPLLCQDCLDGNLQSAKELVGAICSVCGFRVSAVADMVGPVLPV